jgi:hypothetical protein
MLNIQQIQELNAYMAELVDRISNDIRTKPVKRRSKGLGKFEAPVNATGKLAESVEYQIGVGEIKVLAFDYIEKLITGQAPGNYPAIFEIDNWLGIKDLPYDAKSVSTGIGKFGNSIFQEWKGSESNLLENYIHNGEVKPEIVQALIDRVEQYSIDYITQQVLNSLKAA